MRHTRTNILTLLVLLLASRLQAQEVTLPPQLTVQFGTPTPVMAKTDGKNVTWKVPDVITLYDANGNVSGKVNALSVIDGGFFGGDSKKAMISGSYNGNYRLWAFSAKGDVVSDPPAECLVTVVGGQPVPSPKPAPPTPGPGPGPTPPDPGPVPPLPPTPKPIPVSKVLRVLIVYDKAQETTLPPAQANMIYGQAFRDALDSKTMSEAGTGWKSWRIYASTTGTMGMPKEFADLFARPRQSLPWITLADAQTNQLLYEGALPADTAAGIALLNKYTVTPARPAMIRLGVGAWEHAADAGAAAARAEAAARAAREAVRSRGRRSAAAVPLRKAA